MKRRLIVFGNLPDISTDEIKLTKFSERYRVDDQFHYLVLRCKKLLKFKLFERVQVKADDPNSTEDWIDAMTLAMYHKMIEKSLQIEFESLPPKPKIWNIQFWSF